MRKYEVMYIVRPTLEQDAIKGLVERFQNIIVEQGGEIVNLKEMGKRRLAYEIDKLHEGYYVLMNVQSEPAAISELERVFNINEDIMRHIAIREDE